MYIKINQRTKERRKKKNLYFFFFLDTHCHGWSVSEAGHMHFFPRKPLFLSPKFSSLSLCIEFGLFYKGFAHKGHLLLHSSLLFSSLLLCVNANKKSSFAKFPPHSLLPPLPLQKGAEQCSEHPPTHSSLLLFSSVIQKTRHTSHRGAFLLLVPLVAFYVSWSSWFC